jgi:hypothetical protein
VTVYGVAADGSADHPDFQSCPFRNCQKYRHCRLKDFRPNAVTG